VQAEIATAKDIGGNMRQDSEVDNEVCIPPELRQELPRKIRPAAVLVICVAILALISTCILTAFVLVARNARNDSQLAREGRLAHTNDVRVGGRDDTKVFYTFINNGQSYDGEAFIPRNDLEKVANYSKVGNFPILFLPSNPSISHPYDWRESRLPLLVLLLPIAVIIYVFHVWVRFLLRDFRFARNGVAAIARVTNCIYVTKVKYVSIYIKYEFRDMDGSLLEVGCAYPQWLEQGAKICILYLPKEP
jgi:hypothetical protein